MAKNRFDMGPQDISWCPGCGDYGILQVLKDALFELGYQPEGVAFVSGIGQAAKTPHYIKGNFFNGLHGRSLPPATALSLANPDLKVIVTSGDGDMYGEGGNHFIHAIRRNPNITVFVYNNMIYGLTKGQASPTSQKGMGTPVQVDGVFLEPFNPMAVSIGLDASFVARASIADPEPTKDIVKKALQHKGFSLVDIFQPCVSFNKLNTYDWFRSNTYYLDGSYDSSDKMKAMEKAFETEKLPLGIFYKKDKLTLNEFMIKKHEIDGPLYEQDMDYDKLRSLILSKKIIKEEAADNKQGESREETKKCSPSGCCCSDDMKKSDSKSKSDKAMKPPGNQYRVNISEIIDETRDVKSFVIKVPDEFSFKAGQDVMVSFLDQRKINGKSSVPMSISNPPTDKNKIILTIRDMGGFTSELHKLERGDELMLSSPTSESFSVGDDSEDDFVFIAGGTGITPFMSIIRMFLAKGKKNKILLFDANRTCDDIIFKKELDKINDEQEQIKVVHCLSDTCPPDWKGEEGFLCKDHFEKYVDEKIKNDYKWMMCGPPPMVESTLEVLKEIGVPDDNIKYEDWQIPGRSAETESNDHSPDDGSNTGDGKTGKTSSGSDLNQQDLNKGRETGKTDDSEESDDSSDAKSKEQDGSNDAVLASDSDEVKLKPGPIMDSAEELGVPFGCRQGICGTCEVEVVEGADNLEPKTDAEKNMNLPENHRLCCQAKIKSGRVKIDW